MHATEGSERLCLLVLDGKATPTLVALPPEGKLTVGRGSRVDVRLDDSSVSRKHADVLCQPGSIGLHDLGSRNGTRVNGERIEGVRRLELGDVVSFGNRTIVLHREAIHESARGDGATRVPNRSKERSGPKGSVDAAGVRTFEAGGRSIIVSEPAMVRLYTLVERIARSDLPVLVCGETGAGKELVAQSIHHHSKRRAGPLVAINCGALQDTLVESELFGYERGAFTGAHAAKPGRLECADGGTVFLDEVGELRPPQQSKLLRVLETKQVSRVGSTRERSVDIRIVAATNRDLEAEVVAGSFREDLYYRLSAAKLVVPPLRERPSEIPLLARAFLADACVALEQPAMLLSPGAIDALLAHRFSGNIRELKNLMEYLAATVTDDTLCAPHVARVLREIPGARAPEASKTAATGFRPLNEELRDLERARMLEALEASSGNRTDAAKLIGMPLRTFVGKLKMHDLASIPNRSSRTTR